MVAVHLGLRVLDGGRDDVLLDEREQVQVRVTGNLIELHALLGGEGLFFATLRGPGKIWLQSLPLSRMADRIVTASRKGGREQGSVLGGLGNLLDGDNS
jgi:hypothetical protein